jgi:nicotinamide mononucleotide adenylyltransferase
LKRKNKIAIFSGRFDPPTTGHLIAISDLAAEYMRVYVVVLDYPEREGCVARIARAIIKHHFDRVLCDISRDKVVVIINTVHFGKMTRSIFNAMLKGNEICGPVEYVSGNQAVLKTMRKICDCRYLTRRKIKSGKSIESKVDMESIYSATRVRNRMQRNKKNIFSEYRIK